jgi:hypothetical protein
MDIVFEIHTTRFFENYRPHIAQATKGHKNLVNKGKMSKIT